MVWQRDIQNGVNKKGGNDFCLLSGGRSECYWDCDVVFYQPGNTLRVVRNPECLRDCFPADHCVNLLLDDYQQAGGICAGSFGALQYAGTGIFNTGIHHWLSYHFLIGKGHFDWWIFVSYKIGNL